MPGLALDVLGRAKSLMVTLPPEMMDRVIQWAYLTKPATRLPSKKNNPAKKNPAALSNSDQMAFDFIGHPSIYRYRDATCCVEFTLQMARRALEVELREETEFLDRYDRVIKAVNQRYDVRGSDLSKLVMMCLDNEGKVSKHRRKQFQYSVAEEVFEFIEEEAGRVNEDESAQPPFA